jgi:hypothetical protein
MHRPAALRANVDLDAEDTLEALRPSYRDVLGRCPALPSWRSSAPALRRHDQRADNQVRCGYGGSGRRLRVANDVRYVHGRRGRDSPVLG